MNCLIAICLRHWRVIETEIAKRLFTKQFATTHPVEKFVPPIETHSIPYSFLTPPNDVTQKHEVHGP